MLGEELIEKGVVVSTGNGSAKIALIKNDNCEECTAKIFCSPSSDEKNLLEVIDPIGVSVGDRVEVVVQGKSVFGASVVLYLIPLVLLVGGIILSAFYFEKSEYSDVYSFLVGIGLMGFYYILVYFLSPKIDLKSKMPKITHTI